MNCHTARAITHDQGVKVITWDSQAAVGRTWQGFCRECGWTGPVRSERRQAGADVQARRRESGAEAHFAREWDAYIERRAARGII